MSNATERARPGSMTSARAVAATATVSTCVALLVIFAASLWLRWPGFTQGGFASHDVAGILYNGMLLDLGALPYVDSFELKAPGTFFLAQWLAGPAARDIAQFQIWANICALLSLGLVAGLGWRLWGRLGGVVGAALYALHDAHLDSMDANYVTWANLPQIAAFWLGIEATRSGAKWRATLWLLAGVSAGVAALCKRPDGVVLAVLLPMAALRARTAEAPDAEAPRSTDEGSRSWTGPWIRSGVREVGWVLGGFALAQLPICALYLRAGALDALFKGYFLNRWGLRYVGSGGGGGLVDNLGEAALATAHFVGLPLILAAFALAVVLTERGRAALERPRVVALLWIAAWAGATVLAATLGLRFYKGYYLATAAPLCLAAAAPWGLLGTHSRAPWIPRAIVGAALLALVGRQLMVDRATRIDRARVHDAGGRRIADHVLAHSTPGDRVWVWGWHLWDVYPMTGQRSGSRIYKSLGVLSQANNDSWRRPAEALRFVDSERATALVADLERTRPTYIVLGSTVPHRQFEALQALLRREYRRDRSAPRIGRVQFWRLRGP